MTNTCSSPSTSAPLDFFADYVTRRFHLQPSDCHVRLITQGASGRMITRVTWPQSSLIGIRWTNDRADNHSFVPVGLFLSSSGVHVPKIIDYHMEDNGCGWAFTEDLGDANLLSFSSRPWSIRRPLYDSALKELHLLHSLPEPTNFPLQPPFDSNLYEWEQSYFAEHVIGTICQQDPSILPQDPHFKSLSEELASLPRCLLHRDFQSQNIHIVNQQAYLIDFQGMRLGLAEYDLASLLYDPYTSLSLAERHDLKKDWEEITGHALDEQLFLKCALQRLLQATGAYANYGTKGHAWYASLIIPTLDTIAELVVGTNYESVLSPIISSAKSHLASC